MAVPVTITDLSVSEASNSPADSDTVTAATRPSDYLRAHAAILRTLAASDTIAAGATVDLSTKANTFITLTGGATTISALGTVAAGIYKWVIYNAAHTVTHNGTSLILLGGASRTVAAGDASMFVSEGSGNWRELSFGDATGYQPLAATLTAISGLAVTDSNFIVGNGSTWVAESGATVRTSLGLGTSAVVDTGTTSGKVPLVGTSSATDALAGLVELATNAEAVTGTDTARAVTPAGVAAAISATAGLGVGQTWQNVTGSRSSGASYTNSTGKPIMLSISGSGTAALSITIDGAVVYNLASLGAGSYPTATIVVPDGSSYTVTCSAISTWYELR